MQSGNGSDMYTQDGDGHVEENVMDVPPEAFQAIDGDSVEAGGAYTPPTGYEGSVGRTMFDTPTSKDGTLTVLLPPDNIDVLPSQALVRIDSLADNRIYLGAVAEGPFAEPDGLRADATPMVVSTVQGGLLMPKYHGRVQVEIIGEQIDDGNGTLLPPRRRPKPNSPVFTLNKDETAKALSIQGNLRLGLADGFDDLEVSVPAGSKGIFPRHLGILGTTGGGKSTTVSGLIAKAQEKDMAIVLIDTEGEYCGMDEPTEDERMIQALKRQGIEPKGVDNIHIYHLVDRETAANPNDLDVKQFSLRFSALSPYALQEILDLTEAQSERFFKAYDVTKRILEKLKIWPANDQQRQQLLELDEMETGYPRMTLACLYDVVKEIHAIKDKDAAEPYLETDFLQRNRDQLKQLISAANMPGNLSSWRALMGKLSKIKRLKIFDSGKAQQINYREMLQPGRVNILDLSDTDSPQINNLVIAEILRGVQMQQEYNYKQASERKEQPTPTTIFIEEAHEFLSAQRIQKMQVLFQQVARIARRGRKRWLGLVFITQLPQHLPDEVLGLINNWILHKVSDATVVSRLKRSIGGINEGLWRQLPSLAPGQAIGSFTTFTRPLLIGIDPTPCKLLMVD